MYAIALFRNFDVMITVTILNVTSIFKVSNKQCKYKVYIRHAIGSYFCCNYFVITTHYVSIVFPPTVYALCSYSFSIDPSLWWLLFNTNFHQRMSTSLNNASQHVLQSEKCASIVAHAPQK